MVLAHLAGLRDAGWLAACVTVGQAFGGDLEAVSIHSGLLAARLVARADVAVVVQGPGNLGTGTRWGFSGVSSGEAVNAAGVLSGRPVAALRVSQADPRERHLGVSHHSLTALGRVALTPADVGRPCAARGLGRPGALAGGGPRATVRSASAGGGGRQRAARRARDLAGPVVDDGTRARRRRGRLPRCGRGRPACSDPARRAQPLPGSRAVQTLYTRSGPAVVAPSHAVRPLSEPVRPLRALGAAGPRVKSAHDGRGRRGAASAGVDEVHDEDQGLAGGDRAAGAAIAVRERAGMVAAAGHPLASPSIPGPSPR